MAAGGLARRTALAPSGGCDASWSGAGLTNLALVSTYFVPAWGHAALRASTSPYGGFEDRAHSVATIFARNLFDLEPAHPIVRRRRPGAHGARHDLGERLGR